ncbi:MAG: WD40 domain-containing protein [Pirellulales bacterium]
MVAAEGRAGFLGAAAEVQTRDTPTTRLFVQTTPPGAAVKLDGKAQGTAPKVFLVPPGANKMVVEVELDGHASQRREVTIQGGRVTRIEFQLARQQAKAMPKRVNHFTAITAGNGVTIACSADGKLIAIANGNPTRIMLGNGASRVDGGWMPSAGILNAETGKTVVSLKLTTADEDAVLAATERISDTEATALAFSPDGRVVAVGTSIGQVKLFNAQTGELLRSLDDEKARLADEKTPENWKPLRRAMGSVASLAFSPDGNLLATCGGSFADFSERFDGVARMGFRSTGPGRLKLWDVQTGTLKHDLVGHNDHANAVAFSPDRQWLASAGRWLKDRDWGNGVILWNPQTGQAIHSLIRTTANGGARAIAFSPDSKLLALGTQRFDNSKTEDASSGGVSLVHVSSAIEQWLVTVPGWAKPVAFSPDGKSVAVLCGGRSIRFLEIATGTMQHEIRPADSQDVRWYDFAMASQGPLLAIGTVDNKRKGDAQREVGVEVWSTRSSDNTNAPAPTPQEKTTTAESKSIKHFTTGASVTTIACSEDGKLIAIANGNPTFIGSRVKDNWKPSAEILDAGTGKTVVSLKLTTAEEDAVLAATERVSHFEVKALAFSPDGNIVAVGTSIGQVKLFNARTGELVRSLDDEKAKLADKKTPEKWRSLRRAMGSVASLAFSPDGSLLAICGRSFGDFSRVFDSVERLDEFSTGPGRLKVWEVKTGTLKHDLVGHSHANAVSFSPDGSLLASAGSWLNDSESGTGVIIWSSHSGTEIRAIPTEANGGTHAVAFSPNSKLVVISSRTFDKDNDTSTSAISLLHAGTGIMEWKQTVSGWGQPAAFSPDGRSVAVLCSAKSIRFLDTETGTMKHEIRPADFSQGGRWNDFAIAPQGHMLAIGGVGKEPKGSVEVWDLEGPAPLPMPPQ